MSALRSLSQALQRPFPRSGHITVADSKIRRAVRQSAQNVSVLQSYAAFARSGSCQDALVDQRYKNCPATLPARSRSKAKSQSSTQNNWCAAVDGRTARRTDRMEKHHSPSVQLATIRHLQADCVVSNDDPHPQVREAFGLTTRKPVPVKPSLKSSVAPRR